MEYTYLYSLRLWPLEGGINILGTPLGPKTFIDFYLFDNKTKHRKQLSFIQDVVVTSSPRETVAMLK